MPQSRSPFSFRSSLAALIVISALPLAADLLLREKLVSSRKFFFKRDIFNFRVPYERRPETRIETIQQESMQELLSRTLTFSGTIRFGNDLLAILQVGGESYSVKAGETVRGLYKIVKITEQELTISYNEETFQIKRSGEE